MKRFAFLTLLGLTLSACAGNASPPATSTADSQAIETEIAQAVGATAAQITLQAANDNAAATSTASETPTSTASALPATATPSPTASASPSATPSPTPTALAFDPSEEYGGATILDSFASNANWVDASDKLPDTNFIRLVLGNEQLLVTGKPANFDTWWLTWPSAGDQYLEMKVEVEKCAGRQAYGLILRAPPSNTETRGYILTFSCDGAYRLRRLDGTNPYSFSDLVAWKTSEAINSGDDQSNTLGVALIGDSITIYANGEKIDTVEDDKFSSGRFGLFVNAGPPGSFTYIVNELSFWDLD